MKRWLYRSVFLLVLATSAHAQTPGLTAPAAGTKRTDGDSATSVIRALPLRLTLLDPSNIAAIPSSFDCKDTPEEAMRLQSLIQLNSVSLPLTRKLTLHSFSRWGCPSTAGAAVGATYAIKLSPELALVLAGGVAGFPHADRGGWLLRPVLRADLQWMTKNGNLRSVGIDAAQTLRSVIKAGIQRRVGASISGSF